MGVGILRLDIGLNDSEFPEAFLVPDSFSYPEYKKKIKDLFESTKMYREGCDDQKTEDTQIGQSISDLMDIKHPRECLLCLRLC